MASDIRPLIVAGVARWVLDLQKAKNDYINKPCKTHPPPRDRNQLIRDYNRFAAWYEKDVPVDDLLIIGYAIIQKIDIDLVVSGIWEYVHADNPPFGEAF